jgi:hypothetical protein
MPEFGVCMRGVLRIPLKGLILPFFLGTVPYTFLAISFGSYFGESNIIAGALYFYGSYLFLTIIIKFYKRA